MSCQGLQIEKNDISKFLFVLLGFFCLSFCFSDRLGGSLENELHSMARKKLKIFRYPYVDRLGQVSILYLHHIVGPFLMGTNSFGSNFKNLANSVKERA